MQSLLDALNTVKVEASVKPKYQYEYQLVGDEMQKVYGKKVWSLFYKHPLWKIKTAREIAEKRGETSFAYLIGVINHL